MSIQQSVNQAISGSLFLLNQTDYFQRHKAVRDAKRAERTKKEINQATGKADNEGNVPQEQLAVTGEGASANNAPQRQETANMSGNRGARFFKKDFSKEEWEATLTGQMEKSVREAEQAKKRSEEFRKMVLQGVYVRGDR